MSYSVINDLVKVLQCWIFDNILGDFWPYLYCICAVNAVSEVLDFDNDTANWIQ